jgi:hypothetical protein
MIITQTDYIDFLSKSGTSKSTKVKTIYTRPAYHPAFDFYRDLRAEIIENLKEKKKKHSVNEFLDQVKNSKKFSRYLPLMNGYLKFLGRKNFEWFSPPSASWIYKQLTIKMNPEIGISYGQEKFIVKLYFKETSLHNSDIKVLLWMMDSTLCQGIYNGYKCALLDVERGQLKYFKKKENMIPALIEGEAECFIKLWESLERKSA